MRQKQAVPDLSSPPLARCRSGHCVKDVLAGRWHTPDERRTIAETQRPHPYTHPPPTSVGLGVRTNHEFLCGPKRMCLRLSYPPWDWTGGHWGASAITHSAPATGPSRLAASLTTWTPGAAQTPLPPSTPSLQGNYSMTLQCLLFEIHPALSQPAGLHFKRRDPSFWSCLH